MCWPHARSARLCAGAARTQTHICVCVAGFLPACTATALLVRVMTLLTVHDKGPSTALLLLLLMMTQ